MSWKEDPNQEHITAMLQLTKGMWSTEAAPATRIVPKINPMINLAVLSVRAYCSIFHYGFVLPALDPDEVRWYTGVESHTDLRHLHRKGASWRSMLFMQPPSNEMSFLCSTERETFSIKKETPLTMQDTLDGLWGHWHNDPFCPNRYENPVWDLCGSRKVDMGSMFKVQSGWEALERIQQ